MERTPFSVGDVVMFFMQNGRLIEPPPADEIDEATLCNAPCWKVNFADSEQISVESDAGRIIIKQQDFSKVWFLGPSLNAPAKRKGTSALFPWSSDRGVFPGITNIRPIPAEA